jgi:hypothetical protein
MKPLPIGVAGLLDRLREHIPVILGDNLVGIYTYGSITQGAFDPARSDVDCVVLLRRGLTNTGLERLDAWLSAAALEEPWVTRLQISILVKDELFKMDGQGWSYQFGELKRSGSDGNPLIWMNILESGGVVWGPRPQSFVPSITPALVLEALGRELAYLHEEMIDNASAKWRDVPFYRAYVVLTICRILYTRNTGRIGSKPEAAGWALATVPTEWHALIQEALEFDRGERQAAIEVQPIVRFIRFAESELAPVA